MGRPTGAAPQSEGVGNEWWRFGWQIPGQPWGPAAQPQLHMMRPAVWRKLLALERGHREQEGD